jgi:hypothetical protein
VDLPSVPSGIHVQCSGVQVPSGIHVCSIRPMFCLLVAKLHTGLRSGVFKMMISSNGISVIKVRNYTEGVMFILFVGVRVIFKFVLCFVTPY